MFVPFSEMHGDRRDGYRVVVRRPDKERQLGRAKRRREFNLKMGLPRRGMGKHELDFSGLEYIQVVGLCECGDEPSGSMKCGEFLD